ncbi:MAG: AraC family transcriptional regulator, partial [Fimbriimonadaceae bacterium]|nr:AraC family transcriptional regulator [Alphaproteobacteria bacterium]
MANETGIENIELGESRPDDYARVQHAIEYLIENWRDQPSLSETATEVGLNETRFQKLFTRWAGLSPKDFIQALTIDHARYLLRDSASVLDTAYEVGLSGPGRLHDLFVTHEAMSPGEFKAGGRGLEITYGFHPSPFGDALIMITARGLAGLAFCDDDRGHNEILADMVGRWPAATYVENAARTKATADRIFDTHGWGPDNPLPVVLIGT